MGQQAALQGGQLGLSAAQMAQRGAQAGGQLGLQYGQLGQADVAQLAAMAGQQGQMAQGIGALAGQAGQLGGRLGALGQVQAGLGQQAQQQRAFDASQLMGYGGTQQQQAQNVLNAQFAAEQAAYQQPFQQLGFMADLTKALPSSQSAIFQQSSPSPGFGQQVAGLAMGGSRFSEGFLMMRERLPQGLENLIQSIRDMPIPENGEADISIKIRGNDVMERPMFAAGGGANKFPDLSGDGQGHTKRHFDWPWRHTKASWWTYSRHADASAR